MHVHYTLAKAEIHDMAVLCDADEDFKGLDGCCMFFVKTPVVAGEVT